MTEEEKKAIEFLETTKRSILVLGAKKDWEKEEVNNLDTILNLIEKLQKENEDLNNRDTSRLSEIGELRTKNNYLENEIKYYYIPKDKIEKIKNKNIGQYMNFYREIEELLEED